MSEFLAIAQVKIEPSVVGFQGKLRTAVRDAITKVGPQKVEIAPTLSKTFISSLQKQVRGAIAASGAFNVPVVPQVKALRQMVAKELKDRPIDVPIKPTGGDTGATEEATKETRALTEAEKAAAAAEKERTVIARNLAEAETLLKSAMREGISATERNILLTQAQAKARTALLAITVRQVTAEENLFRATSAKRATGVLGGAEKFESGIQAAAAEEEAASKATADALDKEEKERKRLADEETRATKVKKSLDVTTEDLATSEAKVTAAVSSQLPITERQKILEQELLAIRKAGRQVTSKLATERNRQDPNRGLITSLKAADQEAARVRTTVEAQREQFKLGGQLAAVREREIAVSTRMAAANAVEATTLHTLSAVKAENTVLTEIEKDLKVLDAAATKLDSEAVREFVAAKRAEIVTRREALADQRKSIKQTSVEISQANFAKRGFLATLASLIGVRGATLAANNAFLVGAASAAIFAKAVSSAAKLETELNVFRVTAGATADEMERVGNTAKELGADITLPGVGAGDAAGAMTDLAKAGLNVQDSMDGARGSLQLATAAQISNAESTELVASALNAFSLGGTQATHVADLLTGAANEAQGSISDMGIALQQSSAVARQAGLSLEDTVAFITLLAKNGIRGSDAGTSLRTSLLRLIAPTDEAKKQLEGLGITVLDLAGNIRPEVFSELQQALARLEPTARNQTLRKIFGQDAIRAAVIFGREGAKGLNEVRTATNQFGLAAELAGARTAGFQGKIEALKNSLETLGVTFGQVVIPSLTTFIDKLNFAIGLSQQISQSPGGGIIEGLFGTLLKATSDPTFILRETIKQVRDLKHLADQGVDLKFRLPSRQLKTFRGELVKATGSAVELNRILIEAQTGFDPNELSFDEAVESMGAFQSQTSPLILALEQMKGEIVGTSAAAEQARVQLDGIIRLIVALGRKPTIIELQTFLDTGFLPGVEREIQTFFNEHPAKIKAGFAKDSLVFLKKEGEQAASDTALAMQTAFANTLTPESMTAIFGNWLSGVPDAIDKAAPGKTTPIRGLSAEELQARIAGFDARRVRAELRGSTADVVAVLREEQAFLEQQLSTPKAQRQPFIKRLIEGQLLDIAGELTSVAEDRKNAAEDASDKIKDAIADADEAAIGAFTRKAEDAENAILIANSTEDLKDDIKANVRLRGILRDQIKAAEKKIKNLEERRDFKRATRKRILQLTLEIKADQKAAAQALFAAEQERREEIRTSITLDIEFFGIVGNEKAEIRARRRLIQNLQKEIDAIRKQKNLTQEKKNRIQELKNEQARERQAIKELQKEKEKSNDAMRALMFTFLQTQQGFAANLLGNLIPANVSGLNNVNGPSGGGGGSLIQGPGAGGAGAASFGGGLGGALIAEAGLAEAGKDKGPSSGQLGELIEVNRAMLRLLARIAGDAKHPEAKRSKMSSRAMLDMLGP